MEQTNYILDLIKAAGDNPLETSEYAFNFMVKFIEIQGYNNSILPKFIFKKGDNYVHMTLSEETDSDGSALLTFEEFVSNDTNSNESIWTKNLYPNDAEDYILSNKEAILFALNKLKKQHNVLEDPIQMKVITEKVIMRVVTRYYVGHSLTQQELTNRIYAIKCILTQGCYLNETLQILDNREEWYNLPKEDYKIKKNIVRKNIHDILAKWNLKITKNGLRSK